MGVVALDEVDVSSPAQESSKEVSALNEDVNPEPAKEPEVETKEEIKSEIPKEVPVEKAPEKLKVGDKEYSTEEVQVAVEKVRRYQSDRDKAESTLEKFVRNISSQGFVVDENLNITKQEIQKPYAVMKKEILEKATLGDPESMEKLLELQGAEVAGNIYQGLQERQQQAKIVQDVVAKYPDFMKDGKVNTESELYKEGEAILNQFPELNHPSKLPLLAEMAEAKLLKKNLPKMEQEIKNNAQKKFNQAVSNSSAAPSDGRVETEDFDKFASEGQKAWASKFGLSSDRVGRIVKQAQDQGGYYL